MKSRQTPTPDDDTLGNITSLNRDAISISSARADRLTNDVPEESRKALFVLERSINCFL